MKNQLLLLEDIDGLGKSGDVVVAKPGYIRNFLLPKKKAVIADKQTLKMQARLQAERLKKAAQDRKEAEELAQRLEGLALTTEVKIDPDGHLYGSVSSLDIAKMIQEKGYELGRNNVDLPHPLKTLGKHTITLKLKEGVAATISLEILPEGGVVPTPPKVEKEPEPEQKENA